MTKQIGKLYWNPEQEYVVRLFDIESSADWPYNYKYDLPDGDGIVGNHKEASWTTELWDKSEVLEEIEMLEDKIHALKNAIELMEGN